MYRRIGDSWHDGGDIHSSDSSEESTESARRNHYEQPSHNLERDDKQLDELLDRQSRCARKSVTSALVHRQISTNSPKQLRGQGIRDLDSEGVEVVISQGGSDSSPYFGISDHQSRRKTVSGGLAVLDHSEIDQYQNHTSSTDEEHFGEPYTSSSEKELEEERFPTYLSPKYNRHPGDRSDTISTNSVLTARSERISYGKAMPVSRNFDAEHPHLPDSVQRGHRTARRQDRQGSNSSLEFDISSISTSTEVNGTVHQESRNLVREKSSSSTLTVNAEHGNGAKSPRHGVHSNGKKRSKSSAASQKSIHEDISRLAILQEAQRGVTSESRINLTSEPSIAESSNLESDRSRKSSSGRGSQMSKTESLKSGKKISMGDADSIGSATSVIMRNQSRTSKSSGAHSMNATDPNDEILVGDEKDLHDAARRGDCEVVQQLLELGTDINCRNETDRTPIHWAAGNGNVDVLKIMLERDANIEAADKFGMNALLWAAWFGHQQCIQMLLRAGAKPSAKNKNGYSFLHCAAQNNHTMVENILTEDLQEFDKDTIDEAGRTCLHILAKYGKLEMLKRFINLQCSVNAKDKAGNTPLHLAAKYGFGDLIPVLVHAGAKVDEKNSEHKAALHLAAEEGKADAITELIKLDADVDVETEDEVCPLHLAVSGGFEEATIALLNANADIDAGNKHNQTPLHYAVIANRTSIVQVLTLHNADPNVQDARRETPLHLAAENGNFDITEILLRANVNLYATDQRGKTPLNVAARGSFITIVDMILKAERHHLYLKSLLHNQAGHNGNANGMDEDVEHSLPKDISFKPDNSPETQHVRSLLYKLATKYLKKDEWRKLGFHWGFTDSQVQAIEEQYTGEKSYREHGYRMLLIWLNGRMLRSENPTRSLFEGLVAIQRRDLAETMRSKANSVPADKSCVIS